MNIKAYKMDGLGNDFVIIDQRTKNIEFSKKQIIKICDRNFIGCDQLIIIKKNRELDAGLEFYNSDGSTSGACGNGTRCVAYLLSKENNVRITHINCCATNMFIVIFIHNFNTKIFSIFIFTYWNFIPFNFRQANLSFY